MAFRRSLRFDRTSLTRTLTASLAVGFAAGVAVLPGVALLPAVAGAQARPTIASVQRQVATLEREAHAATRRYQDVSDSAAAVENRVAELRRQVAAAQARVGYTKALLGQLAAASYRSGGLEPTLRLLLADDPEGFLAQASALDRVSERQGVALRQFTAASKQLSEDRRAVERELAQLEELRKQLAAEKRTVVEKKAAAQRLLETLREEERRRLEAERRAAAERAAAERAAAARRASRDAARSPAPAEAPAPEAAAEPSGAGTVAHSGACPPSGSRGAEDRLTAAALNVMRCGLATFPEIEFAGGWGTRANATDHDDGRAVDFMIPNYRTSAGNGLGWAVARWAVQQPHVTYVQFDQMMYQTSGGGWERMGNRGSDTANHRDHVHVSVGQ